MRFLLDGHIALRVQKHLSKKGINTEHVNQILDGSETKDSKISEYCILISKDSDFRDSHFIKKTPKKLIRVTLGNVSTKNLITRIDFLLDEHIEQLKKDYFYIELNKNDLSVHF